MKPSTLYSWKECQVKITLSYETKRLAYHCIGERDWEKKEGAASNRASLALIKPFFIHPFFSSTHLFHPSNFFIHPTCALCILPPPKEATERVNGRERRPHREASLAVIKPYLVHIPLYHVCVWKYILPKVEVIPCMFIYTSCPLCRSPPPNLATEWEQRGERRPAKNPPLPSTNPPDSSFHHPTQEPPTLHTSASPNLATGREKGREKRFCDV